MTQHLMPSRALDAELHRRCGLGPVLSIRSGIFMDGGLPVPEYSSSIDAALLLVARQLPEWRWSLSTHTGTPVARLTAPEQDLDGTDTCRSHEMGSPIGDTPALALLACLFAITTAIAEGRGASSDGAELLRIAEEAAEIADRPAVRCMA